MATDEDTFDLPLTDDERYLLSAGLVDWDPDGGPARATEAVARALGFSGVNDLCDRGHEIARAIRFGSPLTRSDWVRGLAAAEVALVSDVLDTGLEWTVIHGGQEAD